MIPTNHGNLDAEWVVGDGYRTLTAGPFTARAYRFEVYDLYGLEKRCHGELIGFSYHQSMGEAVQHGEGWIQDMVNALPFQKPKEILDIAEQIRTQDNAATRDPVFCVQEEVITVGIEHGHSDDVCWVHSEGVVAMEDPAIDDDEYDGDWEESRYKTHWQTVQTFLTQKGADDYIRDYRHRYSGNLRVWADTLHGNEEMKTIRNYIKGLQQ